MGIVKRLDGYLQHSQDRSYRQNEHIRVAEEKLGRRIGKKEIVHHKDENRSNNTPDNLMILRTESDHVRIHSKIPVEIFETSDGSCVVIKKQYECPQCNRLFEPVKFDDIYCSLSCYADKKMSNIPSAEELKRLVWEIPTSQLAQRFGVSDVAIGKWCTKLGVDKPPRGHWQKVAFGKV